MALAACQLEAAVFWKPNTKSAVKAQQVFNIPELVEEIFTHTSPRDIRSATQTQRATSSVLDGSPKLQQKFGLRPSESGILCFPFFENWSNLLSCTVLNTDGSYNPPKTKSDCIDIVLSFHSGLLPRVGSRCREILVCQPAISEMQVSVDCCKKARIRWGGPEAASPLYGEPITPLKVKAGGITVGHVLDVAAKLVTEHRLCPNAASWQLGHDGVVNVNPSFSATVRSQRNAFPIVKGPWGSNPWLRSCQAEPEGETQLEQMGVYTAAKRKAFNAGWRIPTLAEYEANHDRYDVPIASPQDGGIYSWAPGSDALSSGGLRSVALSSGFANDSDGERSWDARASQSEDRRSVSDGHSDGDWPGTDAGGEGSSWGGLDDGEASRSGGIAGDDESASGAAADANSDGSAADDWGASVKGLNEGA
ncbi:hypothetical protein LTR36_008884 [Oleoguttula mirabilis]|uniref:DUF1566 domain-containing protein n=1 Tax=Oleoguttula mirabilis TaxID=1507867 RepID=A0AAV9J7D2_9PEZI|nr:hypothetical protein LTR36_008884 [Oleoguttula mirabilis]